MWFVVANSLVSLFLVSLKSFVLAAVWCVSQGVSVKVQKDKCYSLFCNFLSLYEGKVTLLKVRVLRMGCPIYSGHRDNSLFLPFLKKLFLPVLDLHCCVLAFSLCDQRGLLSSCDARAS